MKLNHLCADDIVVNRVGHRHPEVAEQDEPQDRSASVPADYDVIVCGAGSSGSVIARRLSDDPTVRVLLLEAGGSNLVPSVQQAALWPRNLGSATDWGFMSEPDAHLEGRSLPLSMGKALGGGSSINVMVWARGHRSDWQRFAQAADDDAWGYASVLDIYRRIENWLGAPDPLRGTDGLVAVATPHDPHPVARAMVQAAGELGLPVFDSPNGVMMEHGEGCAISDTRSLGGLRLGLFDSYVRPVLERQNLTVITHAHVRRVLFEGTRAVGVEVSCRDAVLHFRAREQVVLSAGAVNTPCILMRSGIGNGDALATHGIGVRRHLPGVGENLQDHTCFGVVWECKDAEPPRGSGSEATLYASSEIGDQRGDQRGQRRGDDPGYDGPDILMCQLEFPIGTPEAGAAGLPQHGWTMAAGLARPRSRGRVQLRAADPSAVPRITMNALSDPDDWRVARAAVTLARRIGAAGAFTGINTRECLPGAVDDAGLDVFLRRAAMPFYHLCGTAKMGHDEMAVVDGQLAVRGVSGLMVADASIMPTITTGNTMAPCVIIGERAADLLARALAGHR
ncbi:GMC family oxidoreductase [Cupriavidus pampae]|uniref:Oxygen-dependent choline dehydrogenase n=1 Tax=Cupriavidus pampae TaxID=659251 RepID=A0ABM8WW57_9BURK|nr:GMC family oxidoreductase N-terminal domain-containing protein [Cupriavidus pampae]CAG9171755.1 Oxygen-dependent choline dehydrogenase [Cupriavidus pampae]